MSLVDFIGLTNSFVYLS